MVDGDNAIINRAQTYTDANGWENVRFYCPGCETHHAVNVKGMPSPWCWNGSMEKPTFTPSIMVRWNTGPDWTIPVICHSFVRDGQIQYLNDCSHKFAGQTIDLPDIDGIPVWGTE